MKENITGLTTEEVNLRVSQNKQNNYDEDVSKSTKDIFKDNIFTLFNLLNLIIGICLALVGAFSNLFFMVIILINITIGIIQEIRARNLVAKLSIINEDKSIVVRNSSEISIASEEIVLDDIVKLVAGDQVPSDMIVLTGQVEANEALLTGESDLIVKTKDSTLLSGSFISSGQCLAQVIHVGKDNYATKIADEAKVHKPFTSELVSSIRLVAKFTSYVIVPLGLILFFEAYFWGSGELKSSVVASAAALLGMLPKGMVLLIMIALATAVAKLAKKEVLVQDMYSVETLAHVDVICLDKTGTITEGKMKVQEVDLLDDSFEEMMEDVMGSYLAASSDNNITMQAIREYYPEKTTYEASHVISFSSERKWGAMFLETVGTIALGAPERLFKESDLPTEIEYAQKEGYRVLMIGVSNEPMNDDKILPTLKPLAILKIDDPIRENANETLAYLKNEGVAIKVISGDNPVTVSNVARRAGLAQYEKYIDLSELTTEDEVRSVVNEYHVFGRVSPQQKKILVRELKEQGHVVAMTGDGVNDVLALKEADCSIAMAEGDNATRQIANLVLLNSDFTTLPDVLFEGRRVVNNVTKVASIFFIKTIYSLILSVICALTAVAFPFIPIQITLLDLAIEGYPTFFLQFENDKRKVTTKFLPTALKRALPNSMLVVMNVTFIYIYGQINGWQPIDVTTLMYYMLIAVSAMAVIKACMPFNPLRIFLAVTTTVGTYVAAILFKGILEISMLTSETLPVFIALVVVSLVGKIILDKLIVRDHAR
ncbi:cation-translocating P-type ATPase [Vagococcus carniphilus]|uniref:Cation-translocating P-type ATPase n=1 Tax=Vagococcus carniphilus TaxID=218144 RepID=A0AAW8UB36_9ENTE|nr:cation-translocating P-type ATPase [Vagococcus carniphilus]MDT2815025.1 cation-translocating P-type ATPase [Vagococcus carniphilus]MDT2829700.1 cation-translocating P-type ATPase [Vagococcus carniphilus]MDT2834173.1 cation-translocating P-type ATPase [Vagococcus carniphilus]MDT2839159.1 cation-translocating P-type ATPase [Vagococcus carniphilus]MDT2853217.1 cation-translocating P-type ATPase [Vagococcus carniphilus]